MRLLNAAPPPGSPRRPLAQFVECGHTSRNWGTDFLAAVAGTADGANEGVVDDGETSIGAFVDLPLRLMLGAAAIANLSASRGVSSIRTELET